MSRSGRVRAQRPCTDPDTDPGTDPDTDPGTDPDTDPGTDPDTDPDDRAKPLRRRRRLWRSSRARISGQLKKRVLRFLDRKDIKTLYHRVERDSDNFGRVFVHSRWK